jgi:hypothetical protein
VDWRAGSIVAALALAGCGDEPDVTVQANGDGSQITTVRRDGGATITVDTPARNGALPLSGDGAANALGLYPGARVDNRTALTAPDRPARVILTFGTKDPAAAVIAFYRSAAARAGYQVDDAIETEDATTLGGARPDGSSFQLTVTRARAGAMSSASLITKAAA